MIVLVPLVVALFVFRGLGALGVRTFSSWRASARHALAVMFSFTGIAHFTKAKEDLVNMVPKALPYPNLLVAITGVFELLGAIGLWIPAAKRLAGLGLILLLVAMFPANINAAINRKPLLGNPPTPLWLRVPMQLLFIWLAWWSTRDEPE